MSLEAELLMLAGDSEEDGKPQSRSPSPPRSPVATSPKKRTRVPTKQSRKKQRRERGGEDEGDDGVKEESDSASGYESVIIGSQSELDAPMEMSSDDEGADSGQELYPLEGKYKNPADKEKLLAMTEIEREGALAERMAQIERAQQNRHLRNLLKRNAADKAAAASASTRKSLRTKSAPKKTEEATKRGKLDELRRNREERKATGRRSSFGDEDASKKVLSDGEEEEEFADLPKDEREIALADINRCRIGRSGLAKLCDYPGFNDVIQDVFIRVALFDKESGTNTYRMAQAKGLVQGKVYSMLEGNRHTNQYLSVVHGKSRKEFNMDLFSDKPFTEPEFSRFKKQMVVDKVSLPTLSQVRSKSEALRRLDSRQLTDDEINAMLVKRKAAIGGKSLLELAKRRQILRNEREAAIDEGDEDTVIRIDRELQELQDETAGPAKAESQMQRMARLNAENRKRNTQEIRRAEIEEKRAARLALAEAEKKGGSFANPFMRVKTMVKFRHDVTKSESKEGAPALQKEEKKVDVTKETNGVGVGVIDTKAPKGRKKGGVDDVIASMDLGIEIDL